MFMRNRFPESEEIISVYAVGVTMLYTFTLVAAFGDFSRNWILYLDAVDILSLFAYMITGSFIESLLVIIFLLFIGFLLPPKVMRGRFVLYGVIVMITFFSALALQEGTPLEINVLSNSTMVFKAFAGSAFALALLGERFRVIRKVIEDVADRCVVFLYIYMPLSLIAIIIVIFRNIG